MAGLGLPCSRDGFGMTLRLSTVEGHTAAPHPVFGWAVPDLPAVMRDLSARDVQFQVYEGFGQDAQGIWTSSDGKTRISWFLDPEGNVLSLTEA